MSNQRVLTSSNCSSCGCGSNDVPFIPSINPVDQIIVRSKANIEIGNIINEFTENGKKVYELDDLILALPAIVFLNDFPLIEVGQNIPLVTFNGSISAGTYPIQTRSISPDPGGLNLAAPFNFTKANVKRTSPGVIHLHTVSASDNQGNDNQVQSGVYAKNAVYQGFNGSPTLTQAQIKALANKHLVDSLLQQYGGEKTYVVPGGVPMYIYFCGPVGTPSIGSAILNGFALPLTDVGPVVVQNIHDVSINVSYWVKRTSNKFNPGTYKIILA